MSEIVSGKKAEAANANALAMQADDARADCSKHDAEKTFVNRSNGRFSLCHDRAVVYRVTMTAELDNQPGLKAKAIALGIQAGKINWELVKIMVPVAAVVRVLEMTSVIDTIGQAFAPVMELVGLPGAMGLVWATAMLTNLYGGMAAMVALADQTPLTTAQATVIATMMALAHALPVELRIAQRAGARLRMIAVARVGGALLLGWALHVVYSTGGFLQQPCEIFWQADTPAVTTWGQWALAQGRMIVGIFFVVLTLLVGLRILRRLGVIDLLTRGLEPLLRLLGMSRKAAPLALIGMMLGVTYGGGLIIDEARTGKIGPHDVFFSMLLVGLCHSLLEDTALMFTIGGHASGILLGRLAFSLAVVFALARLLRNVDDSDFERIFCRPDRQATPAADAGND